MELIEIEKKEDLEVEVKELLEKLSESLEWWVEFYKKFQEEKVVVVEKLKEEKKEGK